MPSEDEIARIVQGLPETELEAVTTLSSIEAAVLSALEVNNWSHGPGLIITPQKFLG